MIRSVEELAVKMYEMFTPYRWSLSDRPVADWANLTDAMRSKWLSDAKMLQDWQGSDEAKLREVKDVSSDTH